SGRSSMAERELPKLPLAYPKLLERRHLSTIKRLLNGKWWKMVKKNLSSFDHLLRLGEPTCRIGLAGCLKSRPARVAVIVLCSCAITHVAKCEVRAIRVLSKCARPSDRELCCAQALLSKTLCC